LLSQGFLIIFIRQMILKLKVDINTNFVFDKEYWQLFMFPTPIKPLFGHYFNINKSFISKQLYLHGFPVTLHLI
jgi:hypothetical protein